jgi:acyl-CoA thioesterase FadM
MEGGFELDVVIWVSKIGNSSFVLQYEMKSKAGIHAKAMTVQVAVDAESKRSRPLNEEELALLNEYLEA